LLKQKDTELRKKIQQIAKKEAVIKQQELERASRSPKSPMRFEGSDRTKGSGSESLESNPNPKVRFLDAAKSAMKESFEFAV